MEIEYDDHSSGSTIFLIVKAAILNIMLTCGIIRYIKENGIYSRIILLFLLYFVMVTCLLVFELVWD